MIIPTDEATINDNIEGAIKSEPVMDFDPKDPSAGDRQKMVGPEGARVPAWVIHVAYTDHLDPYNQDTQTLKFRINSQTDPAVKFGPIVLGGVRCATWEMNGKNGLTWSCETFTQEPRPSTTRTPAESAEEPAKATAKK